MYCERLSENFGKVDKFAVEDKARSSLPRTYIWAQVRSQLLERTDILSDG